MTYVVRVYSADMGASFYFARLGGALDFIDYVARWHERLDAPCRFTLVRTASLPELSDTLAAGSAALARADLSTV